jgi:hypothetical protein
MIRPHQIPGRARHTAQLAFVRQLKRRSGLIGKGGGL